ncbi:hypothetical protein F0L68_35450 [Solihabitans fulvus]|uniref:Uncharacterized protein n=1 Tax=Solihabitans fulvus TaxID=1892852 RepID=A0A5B2WNT5_9PSEU|nr:hypothetical protein [Solihabitans fulvus]KAA2252352.1 hypothetical protein F0L68_35450 [Solihabitans fulvus]
MTTNNITPRSHTTHVAIDPPVEHHWTVRSGRRRATGTEHNHRAALIAALAAARALILRYDLVGVTVIVDDDAIVISPGRTPAGINLTGLDRALIEIVQAATGHLVAAELAEHGPAPYPR